MEEEKKESILFKDMNLLFVYVVIFIFGLVTVFIMTSVINGKVEEINNSMLSETYQ